MAKSRDLVAQLRNRANLISCLEAMWASNKKAGSGVDGIGLAEFRAKRDFYVHQIIHDLRVGYNFSPLRGRAIPKSNSEKYRIIAVPTVKDRLLQRALVSIIEENLDDRKLYNSISYGFLKSRQDREKGVHAARDRAIALRNAAPWVFKADIQSFFDEIDRERLFEIFKRKFRNRCFDGLIRSAIACELHRGSTTFRKALATTSIKPGRGIRQGMPISPLFANLYLMDFDLYLERKKIKAVRYADDLVVFAETEKDIQRLRQACEKQMKKLGLEFSPNKTKIYNPEESVEFLGVALEINKLTEKYELVLTEGVIKKILTEIGNQADWIKAHSEGLTLPQALERIDAMRHGYVNAFSAASNIEKFRKKLSRSCLRAKISLFKPIVSPEALHKLPKKERTYLMLEENA